MTATQKTFRVASFAIALFLASGLQAWGPNQQSPEYPPAKSDKRISRCSTIQAGKATVIENEVYHFGIKDCVMGPGVCQNFI